MELIRLSVAFESQLDNRSGSGWRECFSSSCAMLARFHGRVRSDDEYNQIRSGYGDTTSAQAQLQALRHLGLKSHLWTNGTRVDLLRELAAGRPVAVGWLHKGHISKPSGGGHWSVAVGTWQQGVLIHDPYGEALLVTGGYVWGTSGAYLQYSWRNWQPRWEVEGPRTGWYLTCSR
jgi:ABC-type bacteriocin/lantibiotic exporter with double-glycine peptidase domain